MASKNNILLVGTGNMGIEYAKVLTSQRANFVAVGRSEKSTKKFKEDTGISSTWGGISKWLKINTPPDKAIVAVTGDQLGVVTRELIYAGCKNILVEKPGGLTASDIRKTAKWAKAKKAKVYIGYNRRFYASTNLEVLLMSLAVSP